MLILLTIFLLIFIPLTMLILYLVWPKFGIQGFLAVLAVLAGWIMVLLSRSNNPQVITLLVWEPDSFFPNSPSLLIDRTTWYFSLALMSLSLSVIITSISQLGHSFKQDRTQTPNPIAVPNVQGLPSEGKSWVKTPIISELPTTPNWQTWAGILILTSLGLVAVTAGNMLTLLLAWVALDLIELMILMSQVLKSNSRERIVLAFTARMAGIGIVLIAGIIPWSQGQSLSFNSISQSTSIYLVLAAILRLGVLPLHLPYNEMLHIRRGLGTILRLVPAAASYILLVRVANVGVLGVTTPYLLSLTALAGLYAAINWMRATDELNGRPFWMLGTAALAVASAILNQPAACLAWSIASILSGGLVFTMSLRHKNLVPVAVLGYIGLSNLPFSPTWLGTTLYRYTSELSGTMSSIFFYLISIVFLIVQSFLLAGFLRHVFRSIFSTEARTEEHIERWVWFLYPLGLIFIIVTHYFIGFWLYPNIKEVAASGWILGLCSVILSGIIWYIPWRYPRVFSSRISSTNSSPLNRLFSLEWSSSLFWRLFRLLTRVSRLFSTILEGDGGILWALVLFALIFVFLQR